MENIKPHLEEPLVVLLLLKGNLIRHEDLALESLFDELLERDCRRFVMDFTQVEFIDSAGIGLIIKLASITEKKGGQMLLCNPQKNVKNVFSMLGIESRFKIHTYLEEALLAFGRNLRLELISVNF